MTTPASWPRARAPKAAQKPLAKTRHGIERIDEYHWLRADNWQAAMQDPQLLPDAIQAHLEAENAYCDAMLAHTKGMQEQLYREMRGRIREDDESPPAPDGDYAYAIKYQTDAQYPLAIRTARAGGTPQVLLDVNALARGHDYCAVPHWHHSRDHKLLAYAIDTTGSEKYRLCIRDIASGDDLGDVIDGVTAAFAWAADNETLFYVWQDENHRPCRVYRHRLGTAQADDVLVYDEPDAGFFVSLGQTQSGRYIVIDCHDHSTSEAHLVDAAAPLRAPICFAARQTGIEYDIDDGGDVFYIRTNAGDAEDLQIMTTPVGSTAREQWRPFVAHRRGCLLRTHTCFADHLVWLETRNALPCLIVHRFSDGARHEIAMEEEAYALGLLSGYEYATTTIRYTYSSPTMPEHIFDYEMNNHVKTLVKKREIPSGHKADDYRTRRIFAPARDGESIPVTLLWHKNTPMDGSAPCLLYGYGAYGISIPAGFSATNLSLVDRGWIHAIAHIRGGKEKGYHWYAQTRTTGKQRTFDDYIDTARHLIEARITATGAIVARGGSAGGLLMGVVANRAPQMFAGIIAVVPFVDTLNTMLDDTLPLTPPEWPEWGNPVNSRDAYHTIAAYSPYDNIAALEYPAILATGGVSDPRVTYWEPAKWVARLRDRSTSDNPVLLHMKMGAGHAGASGRFAALKDLALEHAFALACMGTTDP